MAPSGMVVIRGGRLVDIKGRKADAKDILIDGDTIREIGPPGLAAPEDARVVDATERAMIPGLINSHTHSHSNLSKAIGDRWSLELLLNAGPWISANRTLEDKSLSARLGAVEMVLRGCTACYDLCSEVPVATVDGINAVAQAYRDVGMRAVVAPMMADKTFYQSVPGLLDALADADRKRVEEIRMKPFDVPIDVCKHLLRDWPNDRTQIAIALAPTIPLLCSDPFLHACRDLAAEHGVGIHTHMAESRVWAVGGETVYGKTVTAHLDDVGIVGPGFTSAHAVWIEEDDMRRMADKGASVAHNPGSNMRLGSGLADIRRMTRTGVNVGIGTDSCTCADSLSMFEAMRTASLVSRVKDYTTEDWLSTDEVLTMATEGSARVLGLQGVIGRIEPGYKADIVFLDLTEISFVPLIDITNQIVHCADTNAVDRVMIGGRMVVEDGRVTTIDYDALRREVGAAAERLLRANDDARKWAEHMEGIVGTYCNGLAREHHSYKH